MLARESSKNYKNHLQKHKREKTFIKLEQHYYHFALQRDNKRQTDELY